MGDTSKPPGNRTPITIATMPPATGDYEKLGVFYLGRRFDPETRKTTDDLVLYDSKDLVTHALCVGMTGSGKTGLGIAVIEEAAIDRYPVIVIDPKGDLTNLLLTFPDLRPDDFRPWVNEDDARRPGRMSPPSPPSRRIGGRRDWPNGDRTAHAFSACAMPRSSPFTRRAARQAFPCRC